MLVEKGPIIALTTALYQVTGLLPAEEPLRYKIRETANEILADLLCLKNSSFQEKTSKKIDLLLAYFKVAKAQNWVKEKNFLVLEAKYREIKEEVEKMASQKRIQEPVKIREKSEKPEKLAKALIYSPASNNELNAKTFRQKKIINLMKNQGKISLEDLKKEFSQITDRTLRRDISALIKKGLIERVRKGKKDVRFVLKKSAIRGH